jgi:hypothetical protein
MISLVLKLDLRTRSNWQQGLSSGVIWAFEHVANGLSSVCSTRHNHWTNFRQDCILYVPDNQVKRSNLTRQ